MNRVAALVERSRRGLARIAEMLGIAVSTLYRYIKRFRAGKPLRRRRGPKRVRAIPRAQMRAAKAHLGAGRRRVPGAAGFHRELADKASRRERQGLINSERKRREDAIDSLDWDGVNTVWAIDDTEFTNRLCRHGIRPQQRVFLNTVQDLGSHYKFALGLHPFFNGAQVAERLQALFKRYGAPLVLKRDNGPNLNSEEVDELLSEHLVMALNSPTYYPQYNGAVERAQREIKEQADRELQDMVGWHSAHHPTSDIALISKVAIHELNHQPRASLGGATACAVFHGRGKHDTVPKRQRRNIYDRINRQAMNIAPRPRTLA
jgi:transposase InsO family protein